MAMYGAPVLVLSKWGERGRYITILIACILIFIQDSNTKRETGRKAQLGNIQAAKVELGSLLTN